MHSLDGGEARLRQLDQTWQETGLVSWDAWLAVGPTSNAISDHLQGQQPLQEFPAGQVNRLTCCQSTFDDLVHSLALQVLIVPVWQSWSWLYCRCCLMLPVPGPSCCVGLCMYTCMFIIFIIDYWSLLYSAILRFRADSLHSHVILHEWLAFYSAFLNIHPSGVLTALAWLVPHETAAISARSVYTIQPCIMSLHAKPHSRYGPYETAPCGMIKVFLFWIELNWIQAKYITK